VPDRGGRAEPDFLDHDVRGCPLDDPLVWAEVVRADEKARRKAAHRLVVVDRDGESSEAISVFAFTEDVELGEIEVVGESADLLIDLPECELPVRGSRHRVFRCERRLCLSVYYNTIQNQANVYDGFVPGLGGLTLRTDVPTKYLRVNTENDVWRGQADPAIRNMNSSLNIRIWEIAGASHVPQAAISEVPGDPRSNLGWLEDRDLGPSAPRNCRFPYASHVEVWAVFHAAYAALDRWVTDDVAPAMPPPIQTNGQTGGFWNIVRDGNGIALGGVRLPAVEVPIARNNGTNFPSPTSTNPLDGFCILYGTHEAFGDAALDELYPNHGAYVSRFTNAASTAVQQGVLLRPEAQTLFDEATHSGIGK
jgi:Alpha/beta hydrolase domain